VIDRVAARVAVRVVVRVVARVAARVVARVAAGVVVKTVSFKKGVAKARWPVHRISKIFARFLTKRSS